MIRNSKIILVGFLCVLITPLLSYAEESKEPSLYERIGGEAKCRQIVEDIWLNHAANPIVQDRFAYSDAEYVKQKVFEIFASATGADIEYTGKDMKTAHHTMNISEMEFNAVVDDVMAALDKNGVQTREKNEVLAILWSARGDIVNSRITTKALTAQQ